LRADERRNLGDIPLLSAYEKVSLGRGPNLHLPDDARKRARRSHKDQLMKKFILIAGAATFAVASPAIAHPGNGHGAANHGGTTHGKAHAHSGQVHGITANGHGRLYAFNARGQCPPGLAKRDNGCLPPGQAKKLYTVGQRYNRNFGNAWTYNDIPQSLRSQYSLDQTNRYYYRNGYVYQVDPRTMIVEQVISALLR
jgi:hypothetical protein